MAFTNSNDRLTGRKPAVYPAGGELISQRDEIALVAGDLDANDAGSVTILPAGMELVGVVYDSDDLDTNGAPTIVASIGVMNAADTDLATVLATGITTSQAGGAVNVVSREIVRLPKADVDRRIGVKFTAAAATKAPGIVGLTLVMRGA